MLATACMIGLATDGRIFSGYALAAATFGLVGYAAYARPYVEVSEGEVVLANPLRTVHLTWPAIEKAVGGLSLRLVTAYGTYTAWAAPLRRHLEEDINAQLQAHRDAGHLDAPRLERPKALIRWNADVLVPAALLSAFAIALAVGTFF